MRKVFILIVLSVVMMSSCTVKSTDSCPIVYGEYTVETDSLGNYVIVDSVDLHAIIQASDSLKASILSATRDCRPGMVYEYGETCTRVSDTTFFLGTVFGVKVYTKCTQTFDTMGTMAEYFTFADSCFSSSLSNGYLIYFSSGVTGVFYPFYVYVSDSLLSDEAMECYNSSDSDRLTLYSATTGWDTIKGI